MNTEQPRPHTKYIVSTIYLMQICEFFFRATYHLDSIASFSMSQSSQAMPEISLMLRPASRKSPKFYLSSTSQ